MYLAIWETAKISLQAAGRWGEEQAGFPEALSHVVPAMPFSVEGKKNIPTYTQTSLLVEGKDVLGYYLLYLLSADVARTHSSFGLSDTWAHRYTYYYKYANDVLHEQRG